MRRFYIVCIGLLGFAFMLLANKPSTTDAAPKCATGWCTELGCSNNGKWKCIAVPCYGYTDWCVNGEYVEP